MSAVVESTLATFIQQLTNFRQPQTSRMLSALRFLSSTSPEDVYDLELEMMLMHAAFLVDENNAFSNNSNVIEARQDFLANHVAMLPECDITAWSRMLLEKPCWPNSNRIVVNVIWNWLNGSLKDPVVRLT